MSYYKLFQCVFFPLFELPWTLPSLQRLFFSTKLSHFSREWQDALLKKKSNFSGRNTKAFVEGFSNKTVVSHVEIRSKTIWNNLYPSLTLSQVGNFFPECEKKQSHVSVQSKITQGTWTWIHLVPGSFFHFTKTGCLGFEQFTKHSILSLPYSEGSFPIVSDIRFNVGAFLAIVRISFVTMDFCETVPRIERRFLILIVMTRATERRDESMDRSRLSLHSTSLTRNKGRSTPVPVPASGMERWMEHATYLFPSFFPRFLSLDCLEGNEWARRERERECVRQEQWINESPTWIPPAKILMIYQYYIF